MNTTRVRTELKKYIDKLSPEQLTLVANFFEDLEAEEKIDATEELLNIPEFESIFEKANQEIKEGKVRNWKEIRN
ncbi:hypothetical protein Cyast_1992 [Cyanobacterium stanieri PCC 7202]|uniref:Uncharacterized protein n=1 Tax=Cyanobacterium stanieri (strain ATCC 29140 / PCC 7202) TaxID=292563 RepID=K9YNF5_CYASC|nr:hypothetical protein Cyast_1992 [Cyanobacterium stanieri PCC 7202]